MNKNLTEIVFILDRSGSMVPSVPMEGLPGRRGLHPESVFLQDSDPVTIRPACLFFSCRFGPQR